MVRELVLIIISLHDNTLYRRVGILANISNPRLIPENNIRRVLLPTGSSFLVRVFGLSSDTLIIGATRIISRNIDTRIVFSI